MKRFGRRATILTVGAGVLVVAASATAMGAWSLPTTKVSVTTDAGDVPAGPTPTVERIDQGVKVSWSPDKGGVDGYRVARYTAGHPDRTDRQRCAVSQATACVDTDVKPGETYTYTVRAVRGTWTGPEGSPSAALTVDATVSQSPSTKAQTQVPQTQPPTTGPAPATTVPAGTTPTQSPTAGPASEPATPGPSDSSTAPDPAPSPSTSDSASAGG